MYIMQYVTHKFLIISANYLTVFDNFGILLIILLIPIAVICISYADIQFAHMLCMACL